MDLQKGGLDVLAGLRAEWQELLQGLSDDDPYSRPEWILAYLRAYSPAAKVISLTAREGGALAAVLPLTLENATFSGLPARKLRVPLPMPGATAELVLAPGVDQDGAVRAFWESLKRLPGWDVLELPSVYEGTPAERLCRLAESDGFRTGSLGMPPMPYIPLGGEPGKGRDTEKLPPSATLRSRLRQAERRLSAQGDLRLRRFEKADPNLLQRFYELEAGGWKGKEKSAILNDPRSRQFFSEAAFEAGKLNYLSFYTLELDGRLLSAHFGLIYKGRYYAPKIGYDEGYRQYRPGHLIVREILRDCAQRGVSEYPMGVLEEWKTEWTKELRTRTFRCIFNKGIWSRALFENCFRLKPSLRRLRNRSSP
ncbi:MAG TPA: GNAT family N-acetyltransferase [Candidatus Acidoferrales bacterium]|nr:GNAT family N-acetyltransferase [Candidatus Acidoferrales bacterium]